MAQDGYTVSLFLSDNPQHTQPMAFAYPPQQYYVEQPASFSPDRIDLSGTIKRN